MAYERLIAYFDLLGFRKLVLAEPIENMVARFGQVFTSIGAAAVRHEASLGTSPLELADKYKRIEQADLAGIRTAFEEATDMTLLLMSDSLVIYSKPLRRESSSFEPQLSALIRISRTVLLKLFEFTLPARGALAYGEFYADATNGIFVGRGLVEAYETADSQEWIGAVITPSLETSVEELERGFSMDRLKEDIWLARPRWDYLAYDVPFKLGVRRAYVVNWASAWNYGGPIRDDYFDNVKVGQPSVDVKYDNTLAFLKSWPKLFGELLKA